MNGSRTIRACAAALASRGPDLRRAGAAPFVALYRVDCDEACAHEAARPAAGGIEPEEPGALRMRRKARLRACARWLLGAHLGLRADEVSIVHGRHGRPRLAGAGADAGLVFSTSLCGRDGVIAVASGNAIGIDLERVDAARFAGSVAAHLLHPHEMARFTALPAGERTAWLARAWAGKEAALKALGLGLNRDPREVDVMSSQPGPAARRGRFGVAGRPGLEGRLRCTGALVLALVTGEPVAPITCRRLRLSS